MLVLGCHMSSVSGYSTMVRQCKVMDANTLAFFTRNPRSGRCKPQDPIDVSNAAQLMRHYRIGPFVAHGPYIMNLCGRNEEVRGFSREVLEDDLRRLSVFPGNFYNIHPGSHVGQGVEQGIDYIAQALRKALEPDYPVTVLLETMAGKGSEMGRSFEEMRLILDAVGSPKVGICMDTCHVFDAGYDLAGNLDGILEEFDRVVGLDRLMALHLNDSMSPCGSHKDRHERIGQGKIGIEAFQRIVDHPSLAGKPMILETPNNLDGYEREIKMLRRMGSIYKETTF